MSNFIIHALPRSRTAWLSNFLTYKDHSCGHEVAMTMRSPKDIKEYFIKNQGASETGAAQGWWLIQHAAPEIKTVVVRRKVSEVVESLLEVDISGVAVYDRDTLVKHMEYGDRLLSRISSHPGVLTIDFNDLKSMITCKKIFEHCLPYEFDIKHWGRLKNQNIQVNVKDVLRYYHSHKSEIEMFKRLCKQELRKLRKEDPYNPLWLKAS